MTTTNNMGASEVEAVARIVNEASLGKPVLMAGEVDEEGVWTVATPAGWQREFFTVEPAMASPAMSRGEVCVHNAVSFAAAVTQRKLAEIVPVVYADETALSLVAVLNDDHDVAPGWRDYRVRLALRRSPEWEAWRAVDRVTCGGQLLTQEPFLLPEPVAEPGGRVDRASPMTWNGWRSGARAPARRVGLMRWPGRSDPVVLGQRYRDTVSGWSGVATARYEYMNGCVRIELSGVDKDGKPDGHVFDIQQLEPAAEPALLPPPGPARPPAGRGGDRSGRPVDRP